MWTYEHPNELYHHGIKGMKWGVRRFQKKDGTLTSVGKKRYSDDKTIKIPSNKSNHRLKLEDKYRAEGLSKKDAEQAAARRIRAEKFVAAAAGVTVASCAAYCAYRRYAVDKTIKKDAGFQRIMKIKPGEQLREGPMYMAYHKSDKIKYQGMLGKTFQDQTQIFNVDGKKVMNFDIKPHNDIKVASPKRAKDTFESLYKNNAEFREAVKSSNKEMYEDLRGRQKNLFKQVIDKNSLAKRDLRGKSYDAFNVGLVNNTPSGKKAANMFYNELRKQGVNAVQDLNDKKYSGYRSKNPIIMFGGAYDYSGKVMSNEQINASLKKARNSIERAELIESGAKYMATNALLYAPILAPLAVAGVTSKRNKQSYINKEEHKSNRR